MTEPAAPGLPCRETPRPPTSGLLEVHDLAVGYREGIDIVRGVTLVVESRAITSIIGPNGAGKSTLLRCLFGLLDPRAGRVWPACHPDRAERAEGSASLAEGVPRLLRSAQSLGMTLGSPRDGDIRHPRVR